MFDTVAAISTPIGEGGIGIIRISGDEAFSILEKIFKPINNKNIDTIASHTINFGYIYDGKNIIDEVLVSIMKAPNTYTKEDIVEINCHGGFVITNKVLEIVLKNGAKFATQGEFTKRAFMNGRIDLSQAESVIEIIKGKTEQSVENSLKQLRGDLKEKISILKQNIIDVASHVNVVIDYPEEGIDEPLPKELEEKLLSVKEEITVLINSYDKGKVLKNGIKTSIVGKPNVGKSSLLNALLKEERSIVTHIPGTTRDIIEEVINIKGIPFILIDTAGIRKTDDIVENIGVLKSKEIINKSDLILFIIDSSKDIDNEDIEIYSYLDKENVIGILNKIDIIKDENKIYERFPNIKNWIKISAKQNIGIDEMLDEIYNIIIRDEIQNSSKDIIITNVRHKVSLENTKKSIENIFNTINLNFPLDLISVDLKEAMDNLSEITGEITSEDILDNIFKNFCVGK
ncbi:MAG: tRNA uridine-5-carboxymethylaminomethyl(34) synthesis GTPase MnmE [Fusobacteria bacterium]|nr:tRNA uridine-5-carboxymethylaminomethyl(34) synthesis GTPase MnmE [Fusobacteriota bacterium]